MADIKKEEVDHIAVQAVDKSETESIKDVENANEPKSPLQTKKALIAWLILCYSVSNVPIPSRLQTQTYYPSDRHQKVKC
jgi:hypothetical protein